MLVARQRAACIARSLRPATTTLVQAKRGYASDHAKSEHGNHHNHSHGPEVEESPGVALYVGLGGIGFAMFVYAISRNEDSVLANAAKAIHIGEQKTWEERNTLRTDFIEQAAADRHLFQTVEKSKGLDLSTPDLVNAGCPHNVPAGHFANLEHLVEHYRKEHLEEEEKKLKKLDEIKKDSS